MTRGYIVKTEGKNIISVAYVNYIGNSIVDVVHFLCGKCDIISNAIIVIVEKIES